MIHFYRHIALLLLFLLTGTLAGETAIAMHGISQIIDSTSQPVKTNKYCAAGFLISTDIISEDDPVIQKTEQEDAQERSLMLTSNCHSSLQLINNMDPEPIGTDQCTRYAGFVLLASSQSFILEIADPPRL